MLGGNLQSARHVVQHHLLQVRQVGRARLVEPAHKQVVADAATDKYLFYSGDDSCFTVQLQQSGVVVVQVLAYVGEDARGPFALLAHLLYAALHLVHVGRWPAQVRYVALKLGVMGDLLDLLKDRFLAARRDELALMRRYGAERASAKAAAMGVYRELDHVVRRNGSFTVVTRVGQSGVRQVEAVVDFLLR